jgi:predicted aspartyl protease
MRMSTGTAERFEQEKEAYWRQREELLKQYAGQWVAIVDGKVAAVGGTSGETIREAYRKTGSTVGYVAQVGSEERLYRIRRIAAGRYDQSYDRPIPKVLVNVEHLNGNAATDVDCIVDSGADITLLREDVANSLGLWDSAWRTANIAGVGSSFQTRVLYAGTIKLAGHDVAVEVDCRDDIDEDILGRDVINEFSLTLCAKRDQVEFAWVEDP